MALTIDQIEEALELSGGFVSEAATRLNVTASNIYDRIKKSKRLQQAKQQIDAQYLDLAESKLINKIKNEDLGAICFYLKCKGKERGYIEKQQVDNTSSDGSMTPQQIVILPEKESKE